MAAASQSPTPASSPAAKEDMEKLAFIEQLTTNADAVQERVLAEILGRNADSEYLLRCGLAGATDRATFRAKVPMVTYEDLRPDIMRVANGDRSPILSGSGNPVSEFFRSSGTSGGEPKLIPVVKDEFDRQLLLQGLVMAVTSRHQPPGPDKGRALCFYFVESDTTTPGGLPAYCATTSIIKRLFSMPKLADELCRTYTSPPAAIQCQDGFQSMYAQMLCGLCHRHAVRRIESLFALAVVRAISFLQLNWRQLAADIEAGTLSQRVTDPSVREAVAGVLRPDPELAQFVRAECGKGDWAGIVTRVWPNAGCLATIATGSMAQYVPALNFYSGGLPIASVRYAASECGFGLNLQPLCDPSEVSYTIIPNLAYFEFLPVDAAGADATASELVDLTAVEAGREYEVVVTTYGGLNRFRVGDVLRVAGFHNSSPRVQFVGRRNVLLSIDTDKTDEAELQHAVERASTLLHPYGAAVQDYTSRASTASIPGHYIVYWELRRLAADEARSVDGDVLDRCCLEMEEALGYEYRCMRVRDGSIGPLEIRVVRTGTFEKLADNAASHGGPSIGRYKVPRSVADPAIIQLLDSRAVSSHFSPALPHWASEQLFESDREKCPGSA